MTSFISYIKGRYKVLVWVFVGGILMTPFHNMALMCPATTEADVDTHTEVFDAAVAELV